MHISWGCGGWHSLWGWVGKEHGLIWTRSHTAPWLGDTEHVDMDPGDNEHGDSELGDTVQRDRAGGYGVGMWSLGTQGLGM